MHTFLCFCCLFLQKGYFENRARLTHYGPKNCNVLQIFDRYLYVDYMDEIFIHIRIIPKMRKIRMKRIFLHPHGHLQSFWKPSVSPFGRLWLVLAGLFCFVTPFRGLFSVLPERFCFASPFRMFPSVFPGLFHHSFQKASIGVFSVCQCELLSRVWHPSVFFMKYQDPTLTNLKSGVSTTSRFAAHIHQGQKPLFQPELCKFAFCIFIPNSTVIFLIFKFLHL